MEKESKKIFSSSIVVFWFTKLNKHRDEIIRLMEETLMLVKSDHFSSDSKTENDNYCCYVTKQSLNYLPNLRTNINSDIQTQTALSEFILPIIKIKKKTYILVQNYYGIYTMFGGLCLNSGGLIIGSENTKTGKEILLDYLSTELGLLFSDETKNTCELVSQYHKKVVFSVLNKTIDTDYNCYTVELKPNHLTYLGFNTNICSFFKIDNSIIVLNNKFAVIQISSNTGKICLSREQCNISVSKNIHIVTKNYSDNLKSTLISNFNFNSNSSLLS